MGRRMVGMKDVSLTLLNAQSSSMFLKINAPILTSETNVSWTDAYLLIQKPRPLLDTNMILTKWPVALKPNFE